jgi:membrane-associated phospholipid phosphatase
MRTKSLFVHVAAGCGAVLCTALACIGPVYAQTPTAATATAAVLPHLAPQPQGAAVLQVWHVAARDAITRQKPNQQAALRLLAVLAVAQQRAAESYAGTSASEAGWQALFDTVSAQALSGLMPVESDAFKRLAEGLAATRRSAADTADVQRAEVIGARVAQDALARAAGDGFDAAWTGSAPSEASSWRSQLQPARPPHLPMLGRAKPLFLASGDAIRPPAPPAADSIGFKRALAEVKARVENGDPQGLVRARRWEMVTGSLVAGFWNEAALRLAALDGLPGRESARMLAATMGATWDANIACHDAKYTYWAPRPSQVDPSIKPLVGLPNHPSYPSNHSCDSGAAAEVLGAYFPSRRDALRAMALEAGESRIDGGIHYRFDLDAGLAIAHGAAAAAIRQLGPLPAAVGAMR